MTIPTFARNLICAALALFAPAAFAEPGYMWENTIEVTAMGITMAPHTVQSCHPKDWREPPSQDKERSNECKVQEFKHSGNKMSWKMKCEGKHPVTGSGEITFQGETRYSGVVKMSMAEGDSLMKMSGKRLTACEYNAAATPVAKLSAAQCKQALDKLDAGVFLHGDACNSHKQAFCDRLSSIDAVEQANKSAALADLAATCGKSAAGWCSQAATTDRLDFVERNCPAQKTELLAKHCEGRDPASLAGSKYAGFCSEYLSHAATAGTVQEVAPLESPATASAPTPAPLDAGKALEAIGEGAKMLKGLFRF
jgi:hypothetical protein